MRRLAYAYVVVLFLLGFAVFAASGASVGSTLLLVVLVSQTVLLLPTPAVVAVVALVPFFHAGMSLSEAVAAGLVPFLVGGMLKALLAMGVLPAAWKLVGRRG